MLVLLGKGLYHYLKEVCVDLGGQDVGWTVTSAGSVCLTSTRRCSFPPHAVKNVSLWRTGPLLWQYYPSFVPFRNVTLEHMETALLCISGASVFKKPVSKLQFAGKCWAARGFFLQLDHLSVAQMLLTEDKMLRLLPGCSNMQLSAGGRFV